MAYCFHVFVSKQKLLKCHTTGEKQRWNKTECLPTMCQSDADCVYFFKTGKAAEHLTPLF